MNDTERGLFAAHRLLGNEYERLQDERDALRERAKRAERERDEVRDQNKNLCEYEEAYREATRAHAALLTRIQPVLDAARAEAARHEHLGVYEVGVDPAAACALCAALAKYDEGKAGAR